jgi:prepilin-type N-terminal cleavage/methylation domain-containing protein
MVLRHRFCSRRAFTLLELMTVILIVAILALMVMPMASTVQTRLERTKCMGNLKNLHVAMISYLQDHRSWPQVPSPRYAEPTTIAGKWIDLMRPYGLEQSVWICPSIQKFLQGPDLTKPENIRIDYTATPFDTNQQTPYKWSTQPWFVENANMHGHGNLVIFYDGHIVDLFELRDQQARAQSK